ncbi:hypothetical protein RM549_10880 [Salegentibacter sp. F188]|uniref:ATP-binding protein n=1 Tax=Autumnicola patrickiae TaxID=3075591 RepID=A0ABU3E2U3_9FLAO|nr:hypothetical protein [Salegentibacter sp. F188]MDT0690291.1 hypothetical protein [Salegentibacter sp. F188]
MAHKAYLYSIIFNLLSNAIKFQSDQRPLEVDVAVLKAEYTFSPKFMGLLTLMTSSAYDNMKADNELMRMSYGTIPTIYYNPFRTIKIWFFLAYIGR